MAQSCFLLQLVLLFGICILLLFALLFLEAVSRSPSLLSEPAYYHSLAALLNLFTLWETLYKCLNTILYTPLNSRSSLTQERLADLMLGFLSNDSLSECKCLLWCCNHSNQMSAWHFPVAKHPSVLQWLLPSADASWRVPRCPVIGFDLCRLFSQLHLSSILFWGVFPSEEYSLLRSILFWGAFSYSLQRFVNIRRLVIRCINQTTHKTDSAGSQMYEAQRREVGLRKYDFLRWCTLIALQDKKLRLSNSKDVQSISEIKSESNLETQNLLDSFLIRSFIKNVCSASSR